jgi:hypothetical protein
MASGHTDWQNLVNIALQALAEVIVRMKYGTPNRVLWDDSIAAGGSATLFTVLGTGTIYSGFIHFHGASSLAQSIPMLYIDGNPVDYNMTIDAMRIYNDTSFGMLPFNLQHFDETSFVYSVLFAPYMTFETSFELTLTNPGANILSGTAQMTYALV